jgi:hypothetical protein
MMPQPLISWDFVTLSKRLEFLGFDYINIWNVRKITEYNDNISIDKIVSNEETPCAINIITLNIEQLFSNPTFMHLYFENDKYKSLNNYLYL